MDSKDQLGLESYNYKLLFENMNSGFALNKVITDKDKQPIDYVFIDINPAFERLTGLKREEIINRRVLEVLPETERYWIEKFGSVALSGQSVEFTNFSKELGRYFETKAYCPKEGYFAVLFNDVTDKKVSENKIIESQQKLQATFNSTPNFLFLVDENLKIESINKSALKFAQTNIKDAVGKKPGDALHCLYTLTSEGSCGKSTLCKDCVIHNEISETFRLKRGKSHIDAIYHTQVNSETKKNNFLLSTRYINSTDRPLVMVSLHDVTEDQKVKRELLANQIEVKEKNEEYEAINEELRQTNEELYEVFQKLEESKEKYRTLFHNAQVALYRTRISDGTIIECNDNFAQLLGYESIADIKDVRSVTEHYADPDDRHKMLDELKNKGWFKDVILKIITRQGEERWVKYSGKAYHDRGYLEGGAVDITDLKKMQLTLEQGEFMLKEKNEEYEAINEELRQTNEELYNSKQLIEEREKQFRLLFDNMNDGFALHKIITNNNGKAYNYRFIEVNKVFLDRVKMSHDQIIGKTALELFPKTEAKWFNRFEKVALEGKPAVFTEYSVELDKYYETRAYCPKPGYFAATFSDVTQQRKADEKLKEAKQKAEESERLKTAFLANMSHEIRTPLNGITGFVSLLNPDLDREKFNKYVNIIEASKDQLLSIINNILDLSKIEAGMEEINPEIINVTDIISSTYDEFKIQLDRNIINFTCSLPKVAALVKTDKTKLRQILDNLLSNAIKFTRKGSIDIGYTISDNHAVIHVSDTGIGIRKDQQEIIFDYFRQIDNSNTREFGGTGIGLSLVKSYVELMKGNVWVESEPNVGTTFYVKLELYQNGDTNADANKGKPTDYSWAEKNILIAEDDPVSRAFLSEAVQVGKPHLHVACNGKEAVEIVHENPHIDLILLDIKMPEMNGYEALSEIKKISPHIPVIAQTAFAFSEDQLELKQAGFDAILSKPVKIDELLNTIDELL